MGKLSKEELDELLKIKADYDMSMYKLGILTFEIEEVMNKLSELRSDQAEYIIEIGKVKEREQKLANILENKYGSGRISLETGEIS